jgi:hypothetical protein
MSCSLKSTSRVRFFVCVRKRSALLTSLLLLFDLQWPIPAGFLRREPVGEGIGRVPSLGGEVATPTESDQLTGS